LGGERIGGLTHCRISSEGVVVEVVSLEPVRSYVDDVAEAIPTIEHRDQSRSGGTGGGHAALCSRRASLSFERTGEAPEGEIPVSCRALRIAAACTSAASLTPVLFTKSDRRPSDRARWLLSRHFPIFLGQQSEVSRRHISSPRRSSRYMRSGASPRALRASRARSSSSSRAAFERLSIQVGRIL
jgi:hypothetical protein